MQQRPVACPWPPGAYYNSTGSGTSRTGRGIAMPGSCSIRRACRLSREFRADTVEILLETIKQKDETIARLEVEIMRSKEEIMRIKTEKCTEYMEQELIPAVATTVKDTINSICRVGESLAPAFSNLIHNLPDIPKRGFLSGEHQLYGNYEDLYK